MRRPTVNTYADRCVTVSHAGCCWAQNSCADRENWRSAASVGGWGVTLWGLHLHAETPRMCQISVGKSRGKCIPGTTEPRCRPGAPWTRTNKGQVRRAEAEGAGPRRPCWGSPFRWQPRGGLQYSVGSETANWLLPGKKKEWAGENVRWAVGKCSAQGEDGKALHWVAVAKEGSEGGEKVRYGSGCCGQILLCSSKWHTAGWERSMVNIAVVFTRGKRMVRVTWKPCWWELGAPRRVWCQGSLLCSDFTSDQACHPSGLKGDSWGTPTFGSILAIAPESFEPCSPWARWSRRASEALQHPPLRG